LESIIEISNLNKTYKTGKIAVDVLKGIDITVKRGDFVSIMGPSGSGKSTLLYLIGALDKPTLGCIKVNGEDISSMDDRRQSLMRLKSIGFIFQFYNLVPSLSVEENILLPALLNGKKASSQKERLAEILCAVGLLNRSSHTLGELSGGEQQRAAIARALINEPDIILADEPVGSLDSKTGNAIMELLKQINVERKKTVIQVTHSREGAQYGNRIITIKDGQVCKT
jgi:putative ABC transport system ATP-binding protein